MCPVELELPTGTRNRGKATMIIQKKPATSNFNHDQIYLTSI